MLLSPRLPARFILVLAGFILLVGCSPASANSLLPSQEASASPTYTPDPVRARATTLVREIPNPLLSSEPESAIPLTETPGGLANPARLTTQTPTQDAPTPTRTRLPLQTSDLLYLSGGTLMRWDHVTGYASRLTENVEAYSVSADGKNILLLRPLVISANGQMVYDLDLLDYDSKLIYSLLHQITQPYQAAISPDGKWFAYQEKAEGGKIYAHHTDSPEQPIEIGECNALNEFHCAQLAWSPDSQQVMWSDVSGVWLSAPLQPEAQLVHESRATVRDPKGQTSEIPVTLHSISWSPNGRFVMLQVMPSPQGVHWQAVLDIRLGRLADIPESSEYAARTASVQWSTPMVDPMVSEDLTAVPELPGSRLLVAHGSSGAESGAPFVKIWDALPTNNDLLVLVRKYMLNPWDFPPLLSSQAPGTATPQATEQARDQTDCLTWLFQPDANSLNMGLVVTPAANPTGAQAALFTLNLPDGRVHPLVELPADVAEVLWAPDGSGALILGWHGQVMFYALKDNRLQDLHQALAIPDQAAASPHDFLWLPPTLRR
jgi:hypothetical protein